MLDGGSLKIYASMVKSMDAGIGRVLQALRRAGLEQNTLVIFTSDNGGAGTTPDPRYPLVAALPHRRVLEAPRTEARAGYAS